MKFGRTRPMFWATAAAIVCLLGVVSVRVTAQQPAPAQPQTTDAVFKNIQVFKGVPVDTFFDVMGMFASSMGEDCTFCHLKESALNREKFAELTPRIARARQMVAMMNTLNKNFFKGEPRVTCFTCHRGTNSPVDSPRLSLQYGEPDDDPNVMNFPTWEAGNAQQVLDKYLEALGGTAALAKITSFTAKGTYSGFDTAHKEVPVEFYAKAPNQRTWVVHLPELGESYRVFDGKNGWWAGLDAPAPLETLTAGNLDRYRIEAILAFPAGIKQAWSQWRVGRTSIDDKAVTILQGTTPGSNLLPVNLYFDNKTGLLVRWLRWNATPVGPVPTEINYDDYKDVSGVKMPFTWTASQTYMQMTVKLSEIKPNVPVDAKLFNQPAPAKPLAAR
jgi:photosynthetic reaction center cytochrome c subunit